ncbi:DUF3492 domain-containing protein [Actinacidiphila acididurans]|uniref:D-inositol 3-phosphate glycosyltransferase n=1 Tax=Actinacidiphila acididurans TaxID=2784346 RepID=A0ABS2TWF7_9ACTN|nr:DUF3492 domain-containing protein [Actinacidiphila acididurans]MBM9507677.1 DUF3492 domain-containing protein [Actinacidiphila acididurans]
MRVALLTEGGYPFARGEGTAWCDRLVRGLDHHDFDVYALIRSSGTEAGGRVDLPPQVRRVRAERLWGEPPAAALTPIRGGGRAARRARRAEFLWHYGEFAAALAGGAALPPAPRAERFAAGLYGLARVAAEGGGLPELLRGPDAVAVLESACRAPGVRPLVADIVVTELLTVAGTLERQLRPLSAPWYGPADLAAADLCHALSGGPATLPGLLAKRFSGTPLIVTEYAVRAREALLALRTAQLPPSARALLGAYHRLLAAESYRQAALITSGSTHVTRWQLRCGARPERIRTIHPGFDPGRFAGMGGAQAGGAEARRVGVAGAGDVEAGAVAPSASEAGAVATGTALVRAAGASASSEAGVAGVGAANANASEARAARSGVAAVGGTPVRAARASAPEAGATGADTATADAAARGAGMLADSAGRPVLVWVGRPDPGKDLAALLHAFLMVRARRPGVRLRVCHLRTGDPRAVAYLGHCRALADRLFPAEEAGGSVGFEEIGSPGGPDLAGAYAGGDVVVLSSGAEGFPLTLVEAMFCGRPTVATDVGAVREVVGATGLVVPPRDPRALADAVLALLAAPDRAARLGAAARERALALFTVESWVAAFREGYAAVAARQPLPSRIAPLPPTRRPPSLPATGERGRTRTRTAERARPPAAGALTAGGARP